MNIPRLHIYYTYLYIYIGEDNGTPLQHSCLENPMDGEAWWAAVHGVVKSRTRLSDFPFPVLFTIRSPPCAVPRHISVSEHLTDYK